jgi:Ca2+-binding RTX toxin-like protein
MPNTDNPFGLRPVQYRNGASYTGAARPYLLLSSYATAMFVGDPVVITGAVNTAAVTAPGAGTFPIGALQVINKATVNTGAITGVIVGFAGDANATLHNPASTERVVFVADSPDLVFEIQSDGTYTPASIGLNAALIYTTTGSTVTGKSGAELDSGTTTAPATTAGLQLKTIRFVNREDNDMAASFSKLHVTINTHTLANATAGI